MTTEKTLAARCRETADLPHLHIQDCIPLLKMAADELERYTEHIIKVETQRGLALLERDAARAENAKLWAVADAGRDLAGLEHYEWCDTIKGRFRSVPPRECDCGVWKFKDAIAALPERNKP